MKNLDEPLSTMAWNCLISGGDLAELDLPRVDGRLDLRGIGPNWRGRDKATTAGLAAVPPRHTLRQFRWEGLDLRGAHLVRLNLYCGVIRGCRFDHSNWYDSRLWDVQFEDCTFYRAKLEGCGMSGGDQPNRYAQIAFEETDLRTSYPGGACFEDCHFKRAKLSGVDFSGSRMLRCSFSGLVKDVMFNGSPFRRREDPDALEEVDFTCASLLWTEFRNLNLGRVAFPRDENHQVLMNPHMQLPRLIKHFSEADSQDDRRLAAHLERTRKWLGPNQDQVCISLLQCREAFGEAVTQQLVEALQATGQP